MTPFQIILMLVAGFFAYQVYMYIQGIDENVEPAFMKEPEVIEAEPSADELIEQADEAYTEDNIDEAKSMLEHIVGVYPDLAEARNKLAFVLSKLGENEAAKEQYETSLRIDDKDDMTYNALARLLVSMHEYEKAEEYYQQALKIDDNYEVTWFNYALLMLKCERIDEAKQMFEKVLEIDPNFSPAKDELKKLT